ncbi:MAG: aldehyde dehydrogenase family protein [Phycisphaerales bacterium]
MPEPVPDHDMHPTGRPTLDPVAGIGRLDARVAWAAAFERRIVARESDLVARVQADIGKAPWETVTQDVMPLVASLRWHRRHAPAILSTRAIGGAPWWMLGQRHRGVRLPVGDVLVIATWNYPLQLLGIQLAQSVIAGNRTTVKPSERAPSSQRLLVELAIEALGDAGLDASSIGLEDATREAGRRLLETRRVDHVVFTGSTAVGREIAAQCARTLTPTTLELSGRDSALVMADADVALAARSVWHAATMNAGQTCMAPRRALVDRRALPGFEAAIRPLAESAGTVRLADASMAARCAGLARAAVAAGGRSVTAIDEARDGAWRPACILDCPRGAELAAGDHFGPVLAVIAADGVADMLDAHRAAGQHLATAVFTADPERWASDAGFVAALGSNVVTFNDCILPTAHPGTSIEGRGPSGWGPSRGAAGLLALTREVTCSFTSTRLRTPLDEPSPSAQAWLRRLAFGGRRPAGAAPPERTHRSREEQTS